MGYILAVIFGAVVGAAFMAVRYRMKLAPKTFTHDKMDEIERKLMAGEL
jgi:hypothetical protein